MIRQGISLLTFLGNQRPVSSREFWLWQCFEICESADRLRQRSNSLTTAIKRGVGQ